MYKERGYKPAKIFVSIILMIMVFGGIAYGAYQMGLGQGLSLSDGATISEGVATFSHGHGYGFRRGFGFSGFFGILFMFMFISFIMKMIFGFGFSRRFSKGDWGRHRSRWMDDEPDSPSDKSAAKEETPNEERNLKGADSKSKKKKK